MKVSVKRILFSCYLDYKHFFTYKINQNIITQANNVFIVSASLYSQDSVHLVQYNLLNMGILFQYMPCQNTNMTLTGIIGNDKIFYCQLLLNFYQCIHNFTKSKIGNRENTAGKQEKHRRKQ